MVRKAAAVQLGRRIRSAASQAGMSLRQLGDAIGVSRPTIYAYAAGTLLAGEDRLRAIAAATGVDLAFFEVDGEYHVDGDAVELVEALLAPPNPDRAAEIASRALASGMETDAERLATLAFHAGNALLQKGRYVAAVQRLREASEAFDRLGNLSGWAACQQSLGFCLTNLGELGAAEECFHGSLRASEPSQRWRAIVALAALAERRGDFRDALRMLQEAHSGFAGDEEAVAYVRANEANLHAMTGDYGEAELACAEALELSRRLRLMDQTLEMNALRGYVLSAMGRLSEASVMLMRAEDIADAVGDEARQLWTLAVRALHTLETGRLAEAALEATAALGGATAKGLPRSKALSLLVLAQSAFRAGDWPTAYTHAVQGAAFCAANRYPWWRQALMGVAAASAQAMGRASQAELELTELRTLLADRPTPVGLFWERFSTGFVLLCRGESSACEHLREARRSARSVGDASSAHLSERFLETCGDREAEAELAERRAEIAACSTIRCEAGRTLVERLDPDMWYKGLGAPERLPRLGQP
ncbi:MAG: helix-turn-helix domain-containing protein [Fimbriimonadales bacterium]|nr:helix-turn-helix domain-containing protein [Fimbriimonadales bacterium]